MRDGASFSGSGDLPLLQTKLTVPRQLLSLVARPRIYNRLDQGLQVPLSLLRAPAGFGKTTAVAEWIHARGVPAAWLSLDARDNDPARFWGYAVTAFAELASRSGGGLFHSTASLPWEAGLPSLIDALADLAFDHVLVVDDYHLIEEPLVHESLSFLLRYAPPNTHLVIASRTEPPLPQLPRLRAEGRMVELAERDLRFFVEEQTVFWRQRGVELSGAEAESLDARIGGWAAGMQMVMLSLLGDDRAEAIERLHGSDRRLADYFFEEVFDGLREEEQEFLLQTSILGRFCGSLCDAVTGRGDASAVLADLARKNAFLTCLDDPGNWYAYHHLFAEFLQDIFAQRHPGMAADMRRRAAQWCEANGHMAEAVEYYLLGGHHQEAIRLIEGLAVEMLGRGETATLVRWLGAVPSHALDGRPRLAVMLAWVAVAAGRLDEVETWLAHAETSLQDAAVSGSDAGSPDLDIAMARMILAVRRLDVPGVVHWLEEASRMQRGVSMLASGLGFETKEPSLLGSPWGWYGHLRHVQESLERGDYLRLKDLGAAAAQRGYAAAMLAEMLYEWNRLDEAQHSVLAAMEAADLVGEPDSLVVALFTLARIQRARGDLQSALAVATQAEKKVRDLHRPGWLPALAALRARINLARGNLQDVQVWLNGCRLDVYDRLSASRAYEHLTLARVLLAQGGGEEAVFFLERLLGFAEREERLAGRIEAANLLALALHAVGRTQSGLELLRRSLALGRENAYLRIFVDEGAPLQALLRRLGRLPDENRPDGEAEQVRILMSLLRVSPMRRYPGPPEVAASAAVEPLTAREMAVLRLLAAGMDNRGIAEKMGVAVATVKAHLNHVYAKLGVTGRQEALARAERLGLLR